MAKHFYPTLYQHLATDYQRNLAVTAGAGTGKTEVLTRRIIRIMAKENYCLDRLLVVTFTDKAAVEMKERIYSAIEKELTQTGNKHFQKLKDTFLNNYISTFHGFVQRFCVSIRLKQE
jgi:ATP-dependent helicase/nuclease subunit A